MYAYICVWIGGIIHTTYVEHDLSEIYGRNKLYGLDCERGYEQAMARSGDMTAEDIGSILEAAHTYQRSGMLRAECSEGKVREEGELYLLAGRPIYARIGTLVGPEALNRLLSWRNVSYSFTSDEPRPMANLAPTARWSADAIPSPYTLSSFRPTTSPLPRPSTERVTTPPPFPALTPPVGNPATGPDPLPTQRDVPGMERLVPRKIGPEQNPLSLPLTRRQRVIYLLVDGQRTVADIARTTSKSMSDVRLILGELQEQGFIAFGNQ